MYEHILCYMHEYNNGAVLKQTENELVNAVACLCVCRTYVADGTFERHAHILGQAKRAARRIQYIKHC